MTKTKVVTEPSAPAPKIAQVIALLERTEGASLEEMVAATGWLPHTTRAALTGLRKKRYEIARTSVEGVTRYTIVGRSEPDAE
jgi:hypothetical protein